jgi:uncharacterized protein GlcG (DUF336 family)
MISPGYRPSDIRATFLCCCIATIIKIKGRRCRKEICRRGAVRRGIRFRKSVARIGPGRADHASAVGGARRRGVTEAVAACAKQGYKVTATIIDADGVTQATLRGDGASMTTLGAARDKAYTVFMLGAPRNEDTSGAIAQRMGATPSAGGLAKVPHILLLQGAIRIKVGAEAIGAIGVGGAPGGDLDEGCAKAGLDKISGRLK